MMSDLIDRQAAIDAAIEATDDWDGGSNIGRQKRIENYINRLPSAQLDKYWKEQCQSYEQTINKLRESLSTQPDIIYCKDCVKHNKGVGNYEVHPDGSSTWIWKDSACPLVSWRDKAQGHEFDYQFCAYAERRENG